jgi:putative ABC transport system permease protein
LVVAVLLSILPALHAPASATHEDLREGARSAAGGRATQRGLRSLVVAEIALATMLAIGAGLLIRSFVHVLAVDPGIAADRLLTFRVSFPAARYPEGPQVARGQLQLAHRLSEVPGVQAASGTTHAPLSGLWQIGFTPDGDPLPNLPVAANALVFPDYFEVVGVTVRHGRPFTTQDHSGTPPVVIISETLARRYYGTADAVGRRLKWGTRETPLPWSTIVGVVADVKHVRLDEEPFPSVYMPRLQHDTANSWRAVTYVVRTTVSPAAAIPMIRDAMRDFDPQLLMLDPAEFDAIMARTLADRRFNSLLFGLFAALGLTLAAIGVYGVMQYSVVQRTREIGIRTAFGARRPDLLLLVVGDGARLAVIGIALGLAGSVAFTRVMRTLLFETSPLDVPTFAGVASVMLLVALLSSYVPTRRALRVDPMIALRRE